MSNEEINVDITCEETEDRIKKLKRMIIAIKLISLIIGVIFMMLAYKFLGFERTVLLYLFAIFFDIQQTRK